MTIQGGGSMKGFLIIFFLSLALISGCGQAHRDGTNLERTSFGNRNEADQTTADRLITIAMQDPNVVDATAVVIGNYAIVGLDLPADLDSTRVGSIKYSVAQAIKKEPKGAYAIVTADADVMQRLRELGASIRKGQPIQGIADELADIVSRLMPQIPRAVEHQEQPKSPNPNNVQRIKTH